MCCRAAIMRGIGRSALAMFILAPLPAFGTDLSFYLVSKGQDFVQSDAGPPLAKNRSYRFLAEAGLSSSNVLISATYQPTGSGFPVTLKPEVGNIVSDSSTFSTLAGLAAGYPDGGYELVFDTIHDGTSTNT